MSPWFVFFAALNGATAVAAGAFAAHGLDPVADVKRIGWLRTGSEYQLVHVLAILAVAAINGPRFSSWAFAAGIVFFSGALYGLAAAGYKWLGAVAPIGGAALIAGWLALAFWAIRTKI